MPDDIQRMETSEEEQEIFEPKNSKPILETEKLETEEEIRKGLSGNLCRCTGYENIVKAVQELVEKRKIT